jgi:putative addiction module component (TIGR02574 family)
MGDTMSGKEILSSALKLPRKRRAHIAAKLLESLDTEEQKEIDAAWAIEIEKRIEDMNSGRTKGIPIEQVLSRIEKKRRR